MTDTAASDREPEAIRRMQALKQALEASAAGKAPLDGDVAQHIERLAELVCDGLVGIDAKDIRYALCGPSGQPPDELALAHGQFSADLEAADGIASVLDQIPATTWDRTDGVLAIITAAPDTLKVKLVGELGRAVHAWLGQDGMLFFGTETDVRMTTGRCSVVMLAASWLN